MNNIAKTTDTFINLQVFFEEPFFIAICEKQEENKLMVSKIVFGTEPKDFEVQEMILNRWYQLKFSPSLEEEIKPITRINPKRLQRNVKKQLSELGIGTKSQQALKLLHEQNKIDRKSRSRERKEEIKERQFELKQQKKKEKHRGR
ncbi:YjdF family protein [Anaeromicropila herbilytica]|uniref:DUF2992 family protein n=1 Tax=Anaeromicropila herbilytica TaxID=2785025 RepID=A0A7R7EJG8_9FIRM|nr:YjdF family protein [Anaeromicropila herbilytica]BCN29908.1 hypothetical protein bsdtb5_12030 [Anaeromicropila herbilytica]